MTWTLSPCLSQCTGFPLRLSPVILVFHAWFLSPFILLYLLLQIWKYEGVEKDADCSLAQLHITVETPEGQCTTDALLTGGMNGSLRYVCSDQYYLHIWNAHVQFTLVQFWSGGVFTYIHKLQHANLTSIGSTWRDLERSICKQSYQVTCDNSELPERHKFLLLRSINWLLFFFSLFIEVQERF